MAPETEKPDEYVAADKADPGSADAGQSKAEDAAEDEVTDIITAKDDEPRSFAPSKGQAGDKKDADSQPMEADKHVDKQLDQGLKETFPASDPVSINPGAD